MRGYPAETPEITPVDALIVANTALLLLHAPPTVESPKVDSDATQKLAIPRMAAGNGLMTITVLAMQPEGVV